MSHQVWLLYFDIIHQGVPQGTHIFVNDIILMDKDNICGLRSLRTIAMLLLYFAGFIRSVIRADLKVKENMFEKKKIKVHKTITLDLVKHVSTNKGGK